MLRLVLNQSFFDNVLVTDRIKLLRMDFNMILRCFMPQFLCREVILPQKHVRTGLKKNCKANMMYIPKTTTKKL